ncbi:MAG: peptidase [Nevskia sp.]|nr:peptidase [Nevskia sp.]
MTPATSDRPYVPTDAEVAAITQAIDRDELIKLTLDLCGIPSPVGHEAAAGQFLYDWLKREGFVPRKVGMVPDRFNVVGSYGGRGAASGSGRNLLFTAHLDTESPMYDASDRYAFKPESVDSRIWLEAWLEGDKFCGRAVGNDRGPMVCFLLAAKALKRAGIELNGKLYLTGCPGEIGPEPAEEYEGVPYLGKEIGANYLLTHGGVAPDYVIVAEGTDYGVNWTGCGYAYYRITLTGEGVFTPLLEHPEQLIDHPNPIMRMAPALEVLQSWARTYDQRYRYEGAGGTAIPKVQIAAVRAGNPTNMGAGSEVCSMYVEVVLTPGQTIAAVDRDLKAAFASGGIKDIEIEPYVVRHGFAADSEQIEPLRQALSQAHELVRGGPMPIAGPVFSSMWRDHNIFNMNRIPAAVMGPTRWEPTIDDLLVCTRMYALAALAVCGRA